MAPPSSRHDSDNPFAPDAPNAAQVPSTRGASQVTPDGSEDGFVQLPSDDAETSQWTATGKDSRGGRYTLLNVHAQGGLGIVFKAFDHELNRTVAIKEIKSNAGRSESITRGRFIQEALITAALGHTGIVPIYSMGREADGSPHYAMRLYEGSDLRQELVRFYRDPANRDLNPTHSVRFRELLTRFVQVCKTIAYAHRRGVIHRDLKPANIMLGSYGETLVLDWGLAKQIDTQDPFAKPAGSAASPEPIPAPVRLSKSDSADSTAMGQELGTPEYMSPEQARGEIDRVGVATDVFGLGATLYSILTGAAPIRESTKEEKLARARVADFRPPNEFNRRLPPALNAICVKAMAATMEDRYPSALALAADIENWLADEPVSAYRDPLLTTARRQIRRHPAMTSLAVASLAFLAIGSSLYTSVVRAQRDQILAANELTEQALTKAKASNAAAEDVIEQFAIRIGDDAWSQIPQFEPFRLQMVELAIENRRKLSNLADNDPDTEHNIGTSLLRWANLYRSMNRFVEAEPPMAEAARIAEKLIEQEPMNPKFAGFLLSNRAYMLDLSIRVRGSVESAGLMETTLRDMTLLRTRFTDYPLLLRYNALAANPVAKVLRDLDRHDEAIRLLNPTTRIMDLVADGNPEDDSSARLSAISWMLLAEIARDTRSPDHAALAEIASREAAWRVERMLARNPDDVHARDLEVMGLQAKAFWAIEDSQDHAAAAPLIEQAIERLEALEAETSDSANRKSRLAQAIALRSEIRRSAGDLAAAMDDSDRAIGLFDRLADESADAPHYADSRGIALATRYQILAERGDAEAEPVRQQAIAQLRRAESIAPGNRTVSRLLNRLTD